MWTNIPKHVRAFRKRAASPTTNPAPSTATNTNNPVPSTTLTDHTTPTTTTTTTTPTTTGNPTTYAEPVPKVRELRSGFHGATEWADFRIDERDYNPAQAVKRNSNLSPEQRAAAAERLRASREAANK